MWLILIIYNLIEEKMLWTIKPTNNQQFVCIHMFSWNVLLWEWSIDQINSVLQHASKFVKISWNIVNVNEINFIEPYKPTDIEIFIATQTDPQVKQELQKIIKEREEKNLKTNGVEHLREIYETRTK